MASSFGQLRGTEMAYLDNGLHPVPHSDAIVNEPASLDYMAYHSAQSRDSEAPESKKRICGVNKQVFILWCVIGFMVSLLVIVGGVFGAMLARQESRIRTMEKSRGTGAILINIHPSRTESAPAAATTWQVIPDWQYIGCYRDNSKRLFRDNTTGFTDTQTNEECKNFCQKDFRYFGTEAGGECYCSSTSPDNDFFSPPWNCNEQCKGSRVGEKCGGSWYLSVWKKV
ncbi:pyrrolo-quinoline quinone [Colletotrichum truncatum]|uniref:Pyrrolo-quinoline quinone n=1 Tax=Colletotrichum truncatum TaxID=5467 RepID=A0ACC3YK42_COLTU|nr:pyrrolo-quinoline quinone [Colletotrichum truncatum]KAF6784335.1 pyrrolo-quinoline quinone [Colletotrichum truncatum]